MTRPRVPTRPIPCTPEENERLAKKWRSLCELWAFARLMALTKARMQFPDADEATIETEAVRIYRTGKQ